MEKALLDRRRRRRWNDGLGATIGVTREVVWQSAVLKLMLYVVFACGYLDTTGKVGGLCQINGFFQLKKLGKVKEFILCVVPPNVTTNNEHKITSASCKPFDARYSPCSCDLFTNGV